MIKYCKQCGKPFEGHARRLYCSDKCSQAFQVKLNRERNNKRNNKASEPIVVAEPRLAVNPETIRLNEEAKRLGMSYGQYDAYLRSMADRERRVK